MRIRANRHPVGKSNIANLPSASATDEGSPQSLTKKAIGTNAKLESANKIDIVLSARARIAGFLTVRAVSKVCTA